MESINRLRSAIDKIAKKAVPEQELADIVIGIVKNTSPWEIIVENRFTLNELQIILSPFCKPIDAAAIEETLHGHMFPGVGPTSSTGSGVTAINLWGGLKNGDSVLMIRLAKGQIYYVLHKVGGIHDTNTI